VDLIRPKVSLPVYYYVSFIGFLLQASDVGWICIFVIPRTSQGVGGVCGYPTMMACFFSKFDTGSGSSMDGRDEAGYNRDGHEDVFFAVDSCNDTLAEAGAQCTFCST
jgi:hypothetical protein